MNRRARQVKKLLELVRTVAVRAHLESELDREGKRLQLVDEQVRQLEKAHRERLKKESTPMRHD